MLKFLLPKNIRKVVRIQGGVGNQMFQYAFGIGLKGPVAFDLSFFRKKRLPARRFELPDWQLPTPGPVFVCLPQRGLIQKILMFFGLIPPRRKEACENVFDPNLISVDAGLFDGYFQAPIYFEKHRAELIKTFVPRVPPNAACQAVADQIRNANAVSIHIRRGDYVNLQSSFGLGSLNYYRTAMDYVARQVRNPHFFVFSDDPDWVKENLKTDYPMTYVDKQWDSDIYDIWLMKLCRHNIIANSSFSWWGAWLNEHSDKIVVAPDRWFADGRPTDILPQAWVKLRYFDQP